MRFFSLRRMPIILLVFKQTCDMCSVKLRSLSIIMPNSLNASIYGNYYISWRDFPRSQTVVFKRLKACYLHNFGWDFLAGWVSHFSRRSRLTSLFYLTEIVSLASWWRHCCSYTLTWIFWGSASSCCIFLFQSQLMAFKQLDNHMAKMENIFTGPLALALSKLSWQPTE